MRNWGILIILAGTLFCIQREGSAALIDNGNGTVTDTSTSLIWQKESISQMDFLSAASQCGMLGLDWRLPNQNEFSSLYAYTVSNYYYFFPNTYFSYYWTADTSYANVTALNFTSGVFESQPNNNYNYARCVRGGLGQFSISGNVGVAGCRIALLSGSSASVNYSIRIVFSSANGSYSFTGLSNGDYRVSPEPRGGVPFTPYITNVTVLGANVTAVNFATNATTYTINGNAGVAGATVTATIYGVAGSSALSAADGSYSLTVPANGSYTVIPTKSGYAFNPASKSVTVADANVTAVNFTATAAAYTVSGNAGIAGATVTLSGDTSKTSTSAADGSYSFTGLVNGSYTVTPTKSGYTFAPTSKNVTVTGANVTAVNFTATAATYTVSGNAGIAGATVALSGAANRTTTSAADGSFSFAGLVNGSYTVTPTKSGYTFTPAAKSVTVSSANVPDISFKPAISTYTISGYVEIAGVTITLHGEGEWGTTSAADGSFSFAGLSIGNYSVRPYKSGYTFYPGIIYFGLSADISNLSFKAVADTYSLTGNVGIAGATVTLSGSASQTTTSAASGAFSFSGLTSGRYTVTPSKYQYYFIPASQIVMLNQGMSVAVFSVESDITPPTLTLSTLADGSVTSSAVLNISGTVFDYGSGVKSLLINNPEVQVGAGGNFTTAVPLNVGPNFIQVVATDNAGNQTTIERTITYDPTAPIFTVAGPPDNITNNLATITVTVTDSLPVQTVMKQAAATSAAPLTGVTVAVNGGVPAQAHVVDGVYSVTVNLMAGLNTLQITATDQNGAFASSKRTVTYDQNRPALAITDPAQDLTTKTNPLLLRGTVTSAQPVIISVSHNGKTYTPVVANGSFQQQLSFGAPKLYPVVVTATPGGAPVTTIQRNIIFAGVIGDVNNDSVINVFDALLTLQNAVGLYTSTDADAFRSAADVAPLGTDSKPMGDGKVDVFDALALLRHAVGLDGW